MALLKRPRILYVDNDSTSAGFIRAWLTQNAPGCDVICAGSGREALEHIEQGGVDLYLFEYCLGEMTGPELCKHVLSRHANAAVVICTSLEREIDRDTALKAGARDYLVKPDELDRLTVAIKKHIGAVPRLRNRLFHRNRYAAAII